MKSIVSAFLLKLWGWKVGAYPYHLKKCLIAIAPHTSNWDFLVGMLAKFSIKKEIKFLGKDTLFKPPFGFFFYWLGGYPVNREINGNFVEMLIEIFKKEEEFVTAVAPEGTRKKVDKLKTGFYHICKGANVPILLTQLDWAHKEIRFGEPFYATDDIDADFEHINAYFSGINGKVPKNGYLYEK